MLNARVKKLISILLPSGDTTKYQDEKVVNDWLRQIKDNEVEKIDYVYQEVKSKVEYDLDCVEKY